MTKYTFDDKEFRFDRATRTFRSVFLRILKYFLASVAVAVLYYFAASLFFSTDTERKLRQENRMYAKIYPEMEKKDRLLSDVVSGLQMRDDEIYREIFHTDAPYMDRLYSMGFLAGEDTLKDETIVAITSERLSSLEQQIARVEENFRKIIGTCTGEDFTMPPMNPPLKGFNYAQTGATVGQKINPFYRVSVEHHGLDMIAHAGTPVYAAGKGTVSDIRRSGKGLGNVVEITHEGGYVTRYAHLGGIAVAKGRSVDENTVIGDVGTTGMTMAPCLHYEVLKDGQTLDPVNYFFGELDPYSYTDILIMAITTGQSMD